MVTAVDPVSAPWDEADPFARIERDGIVPVVELGAETDPLALADALLGAGLHTIELTLRTSAGLGAIARIAESGRELMVAAGTVLSVEQGQAAVERGARMLIAPGFSRVLVDWAIEHEVPILPGVSTPTEVEAGLSAGLDAFKFFPAEAGGGPAYLRAIRGPYPWVRFMPTGGIDASNLAGYLALPNVIACGGSWMVARALLDAGDFGAVRERAAEAAGIVAAVRAG